MSGRATQPIVLPWQNRPAASHRPGTPTRYALGGNYFPPLKRNNLTAARIAGKLERQLDWHRGLSFAPNCEKLVHGLLVTR
jgi:hypothetical protein